MLIRRLQVIVLMALVIAAGLAWLMIGNPPPSPPVTAVGPPSGAEQATPEPGIADNTHRKDAVTADAPASVASSPADLTDNTYPGRTLGGMDPGQLADFYRFHRLEEKNRWLVMNDDALRVLEDLYQSRSPGEIDAALAHIRDAAATQLDPRAADQFRTLVREYGDYNEQLAALDRERNRQGLTPEDVDVTGSLVQLQDRVFGADRAEKLFRLRRDGMALLDKHRQAIAEDPESVSREDVQRMKEQYRSLETDDS